MKTPLDNIYETIVKHDPAQAARARELVKVLEQYGKDDLLFQMSDLLSLIVSMSADSPAELRAELQGHLTKIQETNLNQLAEIKKTVQAELTVVRRSATESETKSGVSVIACVWMIIIAIFLAASGAIVFYNHSLKAGKQWAINISPIANPDFRNEIMVAHLKQRHGIKLETVSTNTTTEVTLGLDPSEGTKVVSAEQAKGGKVVIRFFRHPDILIDAMFENGARNKSGR